MGTLTVLLCFGLLANIPAIWAALTIKSFDCAFNPDLIANGRCHFYKAKHSFTYVSAGCTFLKPTENVWIRLRLLRKVKESYQIYGVNVHHNLCSYGKNEIINSVLQRILTSGFNNIKNLNCPLYGNITVPKMRVEMPVAQGFVPPSDYVLHIYLTGTKQNLYLHDSNISYTVTTAHKKESKK